MDAQEIQCPSCGAGHTIYNPGLITLVCEYCGNAVYWDQEKIQDAGKQSILPEGFSRLYRGASGSLFGKRFHVLGRVRYSFGKGFWDEWFLEFEDGSTAWLSEDNHEFSYENPYSAPAQERLPAFSDLSPGMTLTVNKTMYVIEELGQAECLGVEGDLPLQLQSGEKYAFADGASPDGKYTLGIEYDSDPPTIFLGRWIKYISLKLDDEGGEW
ncbi:hypothetical protein CSB45_12240 [candidate division KSB3 bacterium]|uniref:DUF4178 domain-containing protein n=1 Tax=candidate division KSB3 bacterium TaxID=2044937 RepID=A0A2G6E315_9BACT|nr:MAG: hypothetical protein CSB45_12240 [candidate division KSB3 bacterium]PIE28865.1 MAG: hypothetical protein CSA57_11915 [candidate division KSB3 bacterium]